MMNEPNVNLDGLMHELDWAIPEPIAASRALEENVTISSLTLFVFNESGTLIAKNDAESTKKDGNNYGHTDGVYPYKVTLSNSNGNKRIIQ